MVKFTKEHNCCCKTGAGDISNNEDKPINATSNDLDGELSAKHKIQVCLGTSCYLRGANALLDRLTAELGVNPGEATPDGNFALEVVRCFGACAIGPVIAIDEELYPNLSPDDLSQLINRLQKQD